MRPAQLATAALSAAALVAVAQQVPARLAAVRLARGQLLPPAAVAACWCQITRRAATERCAAGQPCCTHPCLSLPPVLDTRVSLPLSSHFVFCGAHTVFWPCRPLPPQYNHDRLCPPPQVLAVPLAMKPLFPGGIMPVTVTNNKLIKELVELRRQG